MAAAGGVPSDGVCEAPFAKGGEDGRSAVLVANSSSEISLLKMSSRATFSAAAFDAGGASGRSMSLSSRAFELAGGEDGTAGSMSAVA